MAMIDSTVEALLRRVSETTARRGELRDEQRVRLHRLIAGAAGATGPAYTDPMQRPPFFMSGLRAAPVHAGVLPDAVAALEKSYGDIRADLERVARVEFGTEPQNAELARVGRWGEYLFYREGYVLHDHVEACPSVARLLQELCGLCYPFGTVSFSSLGPASRVAPHGASHNLRLRLHLGLEVPDSCGYRFGRESGRWQEGRVTIFDDSFTHEVWNESGVPRVVLICDFWHPDLEQAEIDSLRDMMRMIQTEFPEFARSLRLPPPFGDSADEFFSAPWSASRSASPRVTPESAVSERRLAR